MNWHWDVALYHWINHFAGHVPVLDPIMKFFAQYALELYALLFVIAWFTLPKKDFTKRHSLIVAGFAGILALLLNYVIAHIWYRPRPFVKLPPGSFTQYIPHPADSSFPSDHAAGSFAFAFGTMNRSQKWVRRSFMIIAIITMIARVYCGVHYPTDVLAGLLVGLVSSFVMWRLQGLLLPLTRLLCRVFKFGARDTQ